MKDRPSNAPLEFDAEQRSGEELMTVPEVAAFLRLTPKGVYSLVERRKIPFVKVSNRVRFRRADVISWLEENRVPVVG